MKSVTRIYNFKGESARRYIAISTLFILLKLYLLSQNEKFWLYFIFIYFLIKRALDFQKKETQGNVSYKYFFFKKKKKTFLHWLPSELSYHLHFAPCTIIIIQNSLKYGKKKKYQHHKLLISSNKAHLMSHIYHVSFYFRSKVVREIKFIVMSFELLGCLQFASCTIIIVWNRLELWKIGIITPNHQLC